MQDKCDTYFQLQGVALNTFMVFNSKETLLDLLGLARLLYYFYATMADRSLMLICDQAIFKPAFQRPELGLTPKLG